MGKNLRLFCELPLASTYHYYFTPNQVLVKVDDKTGVGLSGKHATHPHVLVVSKNVPYGSEGVAPKGQEK